MNELDEKREEGREWGRREGRKEWSEGQGKEDSCLRNGQKERRKQTSKNWVLLPLGKN